MCEEGIGLISTSVSEGLVGGEMEEGEAGMFHLNYHASSTASSSMGARVCGEVRLWLVGR